MIEQRVRNYFHEAVQKYDSYGIQIPPFELVESPPAYEDQIFQATEIKSLLKSNQTPNGVRELLDIQLKVLSIPADEELRGRLERTIQQMLPSHYEERTLFQRIAMTFQGPRCFIYVHTTGTQRMNDEVLKFLTAHEVWHIAEMEILPKQQFHPLIIEGTATYAGIVSRYNTPTVVGISQKIFPFGSEIQNIFYHEGARITAEVMKEKELPELLTNKEVRARIDEKMKQKILDYYCEKPELLLPLSMTISANQMARI